jgi:hypothetical protein
MNGSAHEIEVEIDRLIALRVTRNDGSARFLVGITAP